MELQFQELLETLIKAVIIPSIPILAVFLVNALKVWVSKQTASMENSVAKEYLNSISETVAQAVLTTSQTYVDTLKAQDKFDEEAQKVAFEKTKEVVMSLLVIEAKDYITRTYGDFNLWIDTKIEQTVKELK